MSDDVLALAVADSSSLKGTDEDFKRVANLAHQQVALEAAVKDLEEQLKEKKKDLERLSTESLPEAMSSIRMRKFELEDGTKISVSGFYSPKVEEEKKDDLHEWMRDNGHGSLIKTYVSVFFNREEFELVPEFVEYIRGWNRAKVEPEVDQSIHHQTLKAWVKQQIENGHDLPAESVLGVFRGQKAKVTLPK